MKKKILYLILGVNFFTTAVWGQAFKVTGSTIDSYLQTRIFAKGPGDAIDFVSKSNSDNLFSANAELLWLAFYQNQPNNPGILTLTSISAGGWDPCFTVRANGNVGIFNLVHKDKDGMLSVDYIGLLPIIVESINEQQQIIEAQSKKNKRT